MCLPVNLFGGSARQAFLRAPIIIGIVIMSLFKRLRISSLPYLSFLSLVSVILFVSITNSFAAQVTLTWNTNNEDDIAGYKIYYGNSSRNYNSIVDVGNQTSYTISNLVDGNTYFFASTAYDINGNESGFSKEISYVALISGNNPPVLPFIDNQMVTQTKRPWSGSVYATQHSRFIHRPDCMILISNTESKTITGEAVQIPNPKKYMMINRQIFELEKQIAKLREKYFDVHPSIIQRKKQLDHLKKLLDEESAKGVTEEKNINNPGYEIMLDTEDLIIFPSIEQALRDGGIACPICNP